MFDVSVIAILYVTIYCITDHQHSPNDKAQDPFTVYLHDQKSITWDSLVSNICFLTSHGSLACADGKKKKKLVKIFLYEFQTFMDCILNHICKSASHFWRGGHTLVPDIYRERFWWARHPLLVIYTHSEASSGKLLQQHDTHCSDWLTPYCMRKKERCANLIIHQTGFF